MVHRLMTLDVSKLSNDELDEFARLFHKADGKVLGRLEDLTHLAARHKAYCLETPKNGTQKAYTTGINDALDAVLGYENTDAKEYKHLWNTIDQMAKVLVCEDQKGDGDE